LITATVGHAGPGGSCDHEMESVDLLLKDICQFGFSEVCRVAKLENLVDGV